MAYIFHIIKRSDWEAAVSAGFYAPGSLEHEGFIHCSKAWQVLDVANTDYNGQAGLVLLRIDSGLVEAAIRSEDCFNVGERFPHIYGRLNLEAVTEVLDFTPAEDGTFTLPPGMN